MDEYILGNNGLVDYIEDYLSAQAALQTITNPSGTFLPSGEGLGEPKYMVDGTRFNGAVSSFFFFFIPNTSSGCPGAFDYLLFYFCALPEGLFLARNTGGS